MRSAEQIRQLTLAAIEVDGELVNVFDKEDIENLERFARCLLIVAERPVPRKAYEGASADEDILQSVLTKSEEMY